MDLLSLPCVCLLDGGWRNSRQVGFRRSLAIQGSEGYDFRYQGDMSRFKRDQAVRVFMSRDKARVMLMSLKCGGECKTSNLSPAERSDADFSVLKVWD